MSALIGYKGKSQRALVPTDSEPTSPALLEFESPSAAVIATAPLRLARGVIWIISAFVISIIGASSLIPIDKVVDAQGKVISQAATVMVQPLDTAIVRSIDVREGQLVQAGQLLARLDPTIAAADMGSLVQQVASLQAEVNRLIAEAEGKSYSGSATDPESQLQGAIFAQRQAERLFKLENYRQKINSLETQIARDLATAAFYRQRLGVAGDLEGMRRELERMQVGSKLNSLAATDNRLEMARNLALNEASAESEKRDLQALVAERDGYDKSWHADVLKNLTDQGRKLDDAKEQLKKARLHHQLVELRALENSIVMTVAKVSVGSVLQSGAQFITLVPSSAPLEVDAAIDGSDAGYVHVGDPVVIKFDTFPFSLYGNAEGTVRVVSPDSVTQQSPASGGGSVSETPQDTIPGTKVFYRSRVTLDKIMLHDTPAGFHIVPGMPVTADIKVGKRTVLSYMLGRVLPVAMDAMREP
jgi:hemolysin D